MLDCGSNSSLVFTLIIIGLRECETPFKPISRCSKPISRCFYVKRSYVQISVYLGVKTWEGFLCFVGLQGLLCWVLCFLCFTPLVNVNLVPRTFTLPPPPAPPPQARVKVLGTRLGECCRFSHRGWAANHLSFSLGSVGHELPIFFYLNSFFHFICIIQLFRISGNKFLSLDFHQILVQQELRYLVQ